jgi:membrane protein DedA with SNARE-associated domain
VFFGRFLALLRVLAALLAGINQMSWPRFVLFNAAGAILWATIFGLGAYYFGHELEHLTKPAVVVLGAVGIAVMIAALILVHRHEADLEAQAERALPGPPRRRRHKRADR